MGLTLAGLQITRLVSQPFGYESSRVYRGLTARRWDVSALMLPAEWSQLLGVYEGWAALKAAEGDPVDTGVVGATLAFSGTGFGQSWSGLEVWFIAAPASAQRGSFVLAQFSIVHAAEQLEILLAERLEEENSAEDGIDYGTETVAGVTLTLLQPAKGYVDGPTASPTATGTDLIEGSLYAWESKSIRGWTNQAGYDTIYAWYPTAAAVRPASGEWFPVTPPSLERDIKTINGTQTERWIVSIDLRRIR